MLTQAIYVPRERVRRVFPASLEKLSTAMECLIFEKLMLNSRPLELSVVSTGGSPVYYTRKFGYFLAFLDFVPSVSEIKTGKKVPPSELKSILLRDSSAALAAIAGLTSSTFFWFWNVLSDCRNLNKRDLLAFPLDIDSLPPPKRQELARLGRKYLDALQASSSIMPKSGLNIQTFKYGLCKPIIDEVDTVLASHYNLTAEERDFVINYHIKHRLGAEDEEA